MTENHHEHDVLATLTALVDEATLARIAAMRELEALEHAFPELQSADSPSRRVGGGRLNEFAPVEHLERMMSLDDVFSLEELHQWVARVRAAT